MDGNRKGSPGAQAPSSSPVEAEAKDRATAVVMAYRQVDWEAVEAGNSKAIAALVAACEAHETARRFLEEDGGELGARLTQGLDRFYAQSVAPYIGRPSVLVQLGRTATASVAGRQTGQEPPVMEEGLSPRSRPQVTVGHTVRMNTGCGHLYVTVNESDDGKPFELFNHMGKAGGCAASQNEAIGRLISYALRCGAQLEPLIKQLKGISCHRPAWGEDGKISSCSDAIGKALEKYYHARLLEKDSRPATGRDHPGLGRSEGNGNGNGNGAHAAAHAEVVEVEREVLRTDQLSFERARALWSSAGAVVPPRKSAEVHKVQGACVDCGSQLSFEEGCVKCHSCGFTECG